MGYAPGWCACRAPSWRTMASVGLRMQAIQAHLIAPDFVAARHRHLLWLALLLQLLADAVEHWARDTMRQLIQPRSSPCSIPAR